MAPTTKVTSSNGVSRQRESGLMSMETTKRSRYLRHCRSIYRVNLLPRRLMPENPFPRGIAPMTFLPSGAPRPATGGSITPDVLPNDQIASENTPIQVDRSLETKPGEEHKEAGNFFVPPMPLSRRREYVSHHFPRGPAPMTFFLHSDAPRPASGGIISSDVLPNDHITSDYTPLPGERSLQTKPGEEHKEAGNVFVPPMPMSRRREYVSQVLLVRKIRGPLDKMSEIIDGMKRSNQTDINIEELSRNFDMIKRILNVSTNKV
ncbi:unnamed protein product [Orchesella dallaii]|uniref:Uncharacterized protein n=1 Tax=Orchesella dallaii TaxID=48710 RepID=A0ABP1R4B4_9HEXA